MYTVSVVFKPTDGAFKASEEFINLINNAGLRLDSRRSVLELKAGELDGCDIVFVFGGDGTILKTVRMINATKPLVVGVNFGHLGFLAEVEPERLPSVLEKILQGNYEHYEIRRLRGILRTEKRESHTSPPVLNEFHIAPVHPGKVATLKVVVEDLLMFKGRMDGLLVSTSMGSTAYSLSAGGPIVDPASLVNVVTPIAPINIAVRPFVVNGSRRITVVNSDSSVVQIITDGVHWVDLNPGEYLDIETFVDPIRLLRLKGDFLSKVFEKRVTLERRF
jgi:NAD+ kinase